MINLRLATMADSGKLLDWRNDPVTIANSLSSEPVTPEHHAAWMERWIRTGFPASLTLIAEYGSHALGVIRFEAKARWTYEVSLTIAPRRRGRGWGRHVLAAGCIPMAACELLAQIKSSNGASISIFKRNGFELIGASDGILKFRRQPCLVP